MTKSYKIKFALRIIINAAIMLALSLFLLNQPVVHDDEKALIGFTADWKAKLTKDKALADSFLFINVSFDKELIRLPNELDALGINAADMVKDTVGVVANSASKSTPANDTTEVDVNDVLGNLFNTPDTSKADLKTDDFKIKYPYGTMVITNRALLARFLQIVNKQPSHKYIICDVLFEHDSPNDDFLKYELDRTPRIIAPSWLDNDSLVAPKFVVNNGLATYTAVDDYFVKYNLIQDTLRTLPLVMYENISGNKLEQGLVFGKMNGKSVFRNFVVNLRITAEDVTQKGGTYNNNYWKFLSTSLLMNSEEEILAAIKGKIIIIGDFEDRKNDYHQTAFGETAGALILLNTYLALVAGDNVIHWALYLILYLGFVVVSFFLFHPKNLFTSWIENLSDKIENNKLEGKIPDNLWGKLIYETDIVTTLKDMITGYIQTFITYIFLLSLVSTAAYLLLNNHISILFISLYVFLLERIIRYVREYRERKAAKQIPINI